MNNLNLVKDFKSLLLTLQQFKHGFFGSILKEDIMSKDIDLCILCSLSKRENLLEYLGAHPLTKRITINGYGEHFSNKLFSRYGILDYSVFDNKSDYVKFLKYDNKRITKSIPLDGIAFKAEQITKIK